MTAAAPITNADVVAAFLVESAIPRGYAYTIVRISLDKRLLQDEMSARERLEILERFQLSEHRWLTPAMIAAIEPMCDKGNEIISEACKLDPGKTLDVFAEHFPTFAVLNPSLIAVLEMMPGHKPKATMQ
jgi:hypothetical protein